MPMETEGAGTLETEDGWYTGNNGAETLKLLKEEGAGTDVD